MNNDAASTLIHSKDLLIANIWSAECNRFRYGIPPMFSEQLDWLCFRRWEIRKQYGNAVWSPGQQCVYDSAGKLINEGSGAGTPDLVSPHGPVSLIFHLFLDAAP